MFEVSMSKGQSVYTPDAGKVSDDVFCGVCGAKSLVTRSVNGPTSRTESLSGRRHLHDRFECPDLAEPWHVQVSDLIEYQRKIPSKSISDIIEEEIKEILKKKQPTKVGYGLY